MVRLVFGEQWVEAGHTDFEVLRSWPLNEVILLKLLK